jgi:biopolymer transport protein ExbB
LVRLHDGNFDFASAKDDGGDIRFVAGDDKTPLAYHIEKYDSLLNEAFVWVKVPDLKPGAQTSIWLYYGNAGEKAQRADNAKGTYDGDTLAVYHFGEHGAPPADSSALGNNAANAGTPSEGSMIGSGLRLDGKTAIRIPASASLNWNDRDELTWEAWIKPAALTGVIFSRREGGSAFVIGLEGGVPYVEVNGQRSPAGAPIAAGAWKHLAVVADDAKVVLYVDGSSYATLAATLPALKSESLLGESFNGEIDELEISRVARPAGLIKLAALGQGPEGAAKLIKEDADEAGSKGFFSGGFGLFGTLLKAVTIDGWVVIAVLAVMAVITWVVMITKFFYVRKIEKGTAEFVEEWSNVSSDLTQLDQEDGIKVLGAKEDDEDEDALHSSPIYRIYHIGSEEIARRFKAGKRGIGPRAFQAIRASLDGGMARESQKLNAHMVFLTIAIAGGPFMGLLGTVIGVMITFAEIAATGEVNINAIAPGIAAALIATVAGLVVAIPALFGYNYLVSKIKEVTVTSQVFIDEFVTKMAEFYPPTE